MEKKGEETKITKRGDTLVKRVGDLKNISMV